MRIPRRKLSQRIINASFAFVLALSSVTASMPFVFSQDASAAGENITDGYFAIDNNGFNVGFTAHDFEDVTSVKVELQKADNTPLVANTGKQPLFDLINGKASQQISSPFYIPNAKPDSSNWNYGDRATWVTNDNPSKAVITITDADDTASLTITPYTVNESSPGATYDALTCDYDFPGSPMWEVTWGRSFENRNGLAPIFTPQSNGGLVTINGAPTSWNVPTLYVTDTGLSRHIDYGFADGTVRTADITFTKVNGCNIPTIVWGSYNKHDNIFSVGGWVFNNKNGDRDYDTGEEKLAGWNVNLYYQATPSDAWVLKASDSTDANGVFHFGSHQEAGTYHICQVSQNGWTQTKQDWSGTPFHVVTANNSPNKTQEGPWCATSVYTDTADRSWSTRLGNMDTGKPTGLATYYGGNEVDGVRYVKSINDLSFKVVINDNYGVVRATYLVQKLNTSTNKFEGFCGNWNANSSGNHFLGGSTHEEYTSDVKSCVSDQSKWTDGTYKIFHAGYDVAGNEGKFNTDRQIFVIDSTKPQVPTGLHRVAKNGGKELACAAHAQRQILYPTWDANTDDTVGYEYTSYNADSTVGIKERLLTTNQFVHNWTPATDGTSGYKVRAVDAAGNKSDWTPICYITYDNKAPEITSVKILQNGKDISEGFTNNRAITVQWASDDDDIDHYVYINRNGENQMGLKTKFSGNIGGSEGIYTYQVYAVDKAGNKSPTKSVSITFDTTPPAVPTNLKLTMPLGKEFTVGGIHNFTNEENGVFSWSAVDDVVGYYFYPWGNQGVYLPTVQPTTPANSGNPHPDTNIAALWADGEGTYHVCITAVDAAGNESACSSILTVTYDKTAPKVLVSSVVRNDDGTYTITGTTDETADVIVKVGDTEFDPGTPVDGQWQITTGPLADGDYDVTAKSTDTAGNEGDATYSFVVVTPVVDDDDDNKQSGPSKNVNKNNSNQQNRSNRNNENAADTDNRVNVLGDSTNTSATTDGQNDEEEEKSNEESEGEVAGESTERKKEVLGASTKKELGSEAGGFAWYWWVLILVVLGAFGFGVARRLRKSEA